MRPAGEPKIKVFLEIPKRGQNEPKMEPKRGPKWLQNGAQNGPKMEPKRGPKKEPNRGPEKIPNPVFPLCFAQKGGARRAPKKGSNMVPKVVPKSSKHLAIIKQLLKLSNKFTLRF